MLGPFRTCRWWYAAKIADILTKVVKTIMTDATANLCAKMGREPHVSAPRGILNCVRKWGQRATVEKIISTPRLAARRLVGT